MAAGISQVEAGPFSVLVQNDFGLEEFTLQAVHPDEQGVPANVTPDTEYAILTQEQSTAYWRGDFVMERQDEKRHMGAFAIRFDEAPDKDGSVVLSHNRKSHFELIEKAMRAGE